VPALVIGHLYLSGMWFDVVPRMDTKKTRVYKRLDCVCVCENMIITIGLIVNVFEGIYTK
jgi:hypothetical protein